MPNVTNTFFDWNASYAYTKWDVAIESDRYFFSLIDNNFNYSPTTTSTYTPTLATRNNNVLRLNFTQVGTEYFQQGSIIELKNCSPDPSINYSGVILAGGPGYVDFLNPGLNVSNGVSAGTLTAPIHPYWTTGFAWIPSWTTTIDGNQNVMSASMGENYSQRYTSAINSNSIQWSLVFNERTDKETAALMTFLQDKGGVGHFKLPFPVGLIYNNPNLKYINGAPKVSLNSFGLNSVSCGISQVFDL